MINLDDLTIGQAKQLSNMIANDSSTLTLNRQINEKVIIRTYSAGVWFGKLSEKAGNEVILHDARRMWRWHCARSISLSGVARYGINKDKSMIAPAVGKVWLEAIEIISLTDVAINSIEGAKDVEADVAINSIDGAKNVEAE